MRPVFKSVFSVILSLSFLVSPTTLKVRSVFAEETDAGSSQTAGSSETGSTSENKDTEKPSETIIESSEGTEPSDPAQPKEIEGKTTEPADVPSETDPDQAKNKASVSLQAGISADGNLSWTAVNGAAYYDLYINDCFSSSIKSTSCDLNSKIDKMIKNADFAKSGNYTVMVIAYDDDDETLASWKGTFTYNSSAVTVEQGSISNVKVSNGTLTWNGYPGAVTYEVWAAGKWLGSITDTNVKLREKINGLVDEGEIEESDSYLIEILALDGEEVKIAYWSGDYTYRSVASSAKKTAITNAKYSKGILSWDAVKGAKEYRIDLVVGGWAWSTTGSAFELGRELDELIESDCIDKSNSYLVQIRAYGNNGSQLAACTLEIRCNYATNSNKVQLGTVANVKIQNGILSWDAYKGAKYYFVIIDDCEARTYNTSFDLRKEIERLVNEETLDQNGSYKISIIAYDESAVKMAKWTGTYS